MNHQQRAATRWRGRGEEGRLRKQGKDGRRGGGGLTISAADEEKIKSRERGRMDTVSGKKERKCWK